MSVSVHGSLGGGSEQTVIGFRLFGRAGSTQGCVTIPFDAESSAKTIYFALHEMSAAYSSQGGIYGSNDGTTYTKVVGFSNYGYQWFKVGEVSGYRYYRVAFSTSGGTGTNYGMLYGALSFEGDNADSMNIFIYGPTNSINHIYTNSGDIDTKDTETSTTEVDKSIITSW